MSEAGMPSKPKGRRRAHGEGAITKRKDGRWQVMVDAGYVDGKRKRLYAYTKTQREAVDALADLKKKARIYSQHNSEIRTVEQYLNYWLDSVVAKSRAPKTLEIYRVTMVTHVIPILGKKKVDSVTRIDVQRMLDRIAEKPKHKAKPDENGTVPRIGTRSVENVRTVLRTAFNHAIKLGLIHDNPVEHTTIQRVVQKDRQALTVEQAQSLLAEVGDDRFEALYVLAAVYGLRRGECLGLRWSDIDEQSSEIRVRQQVIVVDSRPTISPLKTRASIRTLPLLGFVKEALDRRRDHQATEKLLASTRWQEHGLVFTSAVGTPYQPANLRKRWLEHLEGAGLPEVPFHSLRHTAASFLVALNVHPRVAMEILGHSNIKTTMEVYSHAQQSGMREALESVENVLRRAENGS